MASRCGCGSAQCSCAVTGGTGITVTGVGSSGNPYVVTAVGADLEISDQPSLDLTLTGDGTPSSPWVISGAVTPSATAGNLLTLDTGGAVVLSSAVRAAVGATVGAGLGYVSGTGSLIAKISTDSGNVLSIGTDGGLLSPAATTVVAAPLHLSNSTGNTLVDGKVSGDTVPRIVLVADGPIQWADGTNAPDTNLYRAGVGVLRTDTSLVAGGGFTSQTRYITSAITGTYAASDRRWSTGPDTTPEGGSNVGSEFTISRYSDAGALLDTPFQIDRSNGRVYIGGLAGTSGAGLTVQRNSTGVVLNLINGTASGQGALFSLKDTASTALAVQVTGDTASRFTLGPDGKQQWGTGSAAADTNLYRTAAGVLVTDTAFGASNWPRGAWSTWTPTWTTSTGLHSPVYNNAAVSATYTKHGRTLTYSISITFGSSTNFGASVTSADNWQFSLPPGLVAAAAWATGMIPAGSARMSQGAGAVCMGQMQVDTAGTDLIISISSGRVDGAAITNNGVADSLSPWTWASTHTLQMWGSLECTT